MSTMSLSANAVDAPVVFLKRVLALDAASCVLMGAALLALAGPLSGWLALPDAVLWWAGLLLLPCAALMGAAAAAARPPAPLLALIIGGNGLWVVASLLVARVWFTPNALGTAFVMLQAAFVLLMAVLEWRGLRRLAR